jgi:multicomponent Na+:H+ antiporter subunit G
MEIVFYIFLGIGLFACSMSVLGLMRFPDVYTRLHAATKTTTFGSIFIVAAVVIMNFSVNDSNSFTVILHSIAALAVIIFTNPISAHAIARAAMLSGIKPHGAKVDEFSAQFKKSETDFTGDKKIES